MHKLSFKTSFFLFVLFLSFSISSMHNTAVVEDIISAIGTDNFPQEQIRSKIFNFFIVMGFAYATVIFRRLYNISEDVSCKI